MNAKIGYHYIVKINYVVRRWFPNLKNQEIPPQNQTRKDAYPYLRKTEFNLICSTRSKLNAVTDKLDELMEQDEGRIGIYDKIGVDWSYFVESVVYVGEIRL